MAVLAWFHTSATVLDSLISFTQIYIHCTREELAVATRVGSLSAQFKYFQRLRFKTVIFQSQSHFSDNYSASAWSQGTLVVLCPNTTILNLTGPNCCLMRGAACVHRRHHSDHHTQPGCQRHCVDENLERRNHYLDLAGIENYTSRFGAG